MKLFQKPLLLLSALLGGIALLVFELNRPSAEVPSVPPNSPSGSLPPAELVVQLETLRETLRTEKQAASTKVAALEAEVNRLKKELSIQGGNADAPKPKQQTPARQASSQGADAPPETPFARSVLDLAMKAGRLNTQIQSHPELDIPELQYLDEGDWIHFAKEADLDSEGGVRKVLADLRQRAKDRFAKVAMQALSSYSAANGGQAPFSIGQLTPYFSEAVDPTLLQRYALIPSNSPQQPASPSIGGPMILREKAPVDPQYDTGFDIGPAGWTSVGVGMGYLHKMR
jgi:hypothetical protein